MKFTASKNGAPISPKSEMDTQAAYDAYNAAAGRQGWPPARILSETRKRALNGRLKDAGGLAGWNQALANAEKSGFLTGKISRGNGHANWTPDLDFFLQRKSFIRLFEGFYDDRTSKAEPTTGLLAALAALASESPRRG